jgi:hypothetical protein
VKHEPDAPYDIGFARLLQLKEMPPQVQVWRYPEIGLAKMDEGRDDGDGIRDEMHHLDPVEVQQPTEEVTG